MKHLAVLALLLALLDAGPARAYVRYRTEIGNIPFYWQASCVPIAIYTGSFTDMTADEVAKSVSAAAHTWSPDEVTCEDGVSHPYLEIVPTFAGNGKGHVGYDAINVLKFETDKWEHINEALALTTVLVKPDGRIIDADIQVNATPTLTWMNLDTSVPTHGQDIHDLQNALTHEFGHLIGLDHSCYTATADANGKVKPRPKDDYTKMDVPDCDSAPPELHETVMYPSVTAGETYKRVLSIDEIRAICGIYPATEDPHICPMDSPNDGIGCATAARDRLPASPGRGRPLLALGAALGALGLGRIRRRRRGG